MALDVTQPDLALFSIRRITEMDTVLGEIAYERVSVMGGGQPVAG